MNAWRATKCTTWAKTSFPFSYQSNPSNVYFDNPATNWTSGQTASSPYFPASINALANPYKTPTAAQWSLGIQQQLRENAVLTVTYVGNSNYHQSEGININALSPSDTQDRLGVCGRTCGYTGSPLESQPLPAVPGLGNHLAHVHGCELQLRIAADRLPSHSVAQYHD